MKKRQAGLTLIELLVAISVVAILLGLGVPSFQQTAASNALRSTSIDMVTSLNTARMQAVNLRGDVTVVAKGGGWTEGWLVNFPGNSIEENQEFTTHAGVTITMQGNGTDISFLARGGVQGGGTSFLICHERLSDGRRVSVSFLGKITNVIEVCP